MKKFFCFLIASMLVISMFGCNRDKENMQKPVNFYYCNQSIAYDSESAVISAEVRDGAAYAHDLKSIIELYLQGPVSDSYYSPFPTGSRINSWEQTDATVHVTMNTSFAELKGLELTIACACLAKTVMELTGCEAVEVSVDDAALDGSSSVVMDSQSLLLLDDSL